jgi:hypothetical protein
LHSNGTFFPDLLARDFRHARIITWGYDANVARFDGKKLQNASSEGLLSYGQSLAYAIRDSRQNEVPPTRPIYFIAHSLGGLVVEQALLICIGADESLHDIGTATAGILFMGTPHQGSHLAKLGSILGKLIPANLRTVNQRAIDVLKADSEVCKSLESAFQEHAKHGKFRNIRLFSFYETIAMNGFAEMIVPEWSAVLSGDFKSPIHGTHTSMTRFEGPSDDGYRKVRGQLLSWLQSKPPGQLTEKKPAKRKGKSKENFGSIILNGPTFSGPITGSTIIATQNIASGNMYYYSGDRPDTKEDSSDGSEVDDGAELMMDDGGWIGKI